MSHYIIYVPGLGDHRSRLQALAVKAWQIYGVKTEIHRMHWRSHDFTGRLHILLDRIDTLHSQGHTVSLIGVSAGASAALHAFAQRPQQVHAVVCLCGKLNRADTISSRTYARNPAFKRSMQTLAASLDKLDKIQRGRVLSIHPLHDGLVPVPDTYLDGAHRRTLPTIGHAFSIAFAITLYSYGIVHFLRTVRQQK